MGHYLTDCPTVTADQKQDWVKAAEKVKRARANRPAAELGGEAVRLSSARRLFFSANGWGRQSRDESSSDCSRRLRENREASARQG